MNREAKIGLFAVLVLAVLVSVMWAKLAGDDPREVTSNDNPTPTVDVTSQRQTMMANESLQGNIGSNFGSSGDTGTGLPSGLQDGNDYTSPGEGYDPYDLYKNRTVTENKRTVDDYDPFSLYGDKELSDINKDRSTENNTLDPIADLWPHFGTTDELVKSGDERTVFTRTTEFGGTYNTQAGWPKTHAVAKGDTLSTISEKYYDTGKHWRLIADANTAVLPEPSMLRIGMKLRVPQPPPARETRAEEADSAIPRAGFTYKVKKGDTLSSISRTAYGTAKRWNSILAANENKLPSPERLAVGMVISLPRNPR